MQGEKKNAILVVDKEKKVAPLAIASTGGVIMLLQWILGLNLVVLIGAIYLCVVALLIFLGIVTKKKLYLFLTVGYGAVTFGILTHFLFRGADAGWGAFSSASTGFSSADHALWQGEGNFGTRLAGNLLICSPALLLIGGIYLAVLKIKKDPKVRLAVASVLAILTLGMSIIMVFVMNLRSDPAVFDMKRGHDDYLDGIKQTVDSDSPNVLVILMDDLGYGDTSYNARKGNRTPAFETPNIDRIAEEGVDFDNFYSSYSVCSPARFALMTGRYPYRGYADNVIYPTVNTLDPFASTRVFNSFEMGANVDGMLGDEVTVAEVFQRAGYSTGCFGKWHLGDYGQYLPTNQGFDYFYGSHHVNDMAPFYHAEERNGEYEIAVGSDDLDQSDASRLIHDKTAGWIEDEINAGNKFFAYYATPWPHAPVYAGYDYQGTSGAGIYGDCVTEFDYYLGELFAMLEAKGVLDDTLIIFSSDNGPALQGSVNELRGGKYSAYDGGQKVPFYMRWGNNPSFSSGVEGVAKTVEGIATFVDLFPTLVDLCGIKGTVGSVEKTNYLPSDIDREMDGASMVPLVNDVTGSAYIHGKDKPILHMKREKINAIQYTVDKTTVLKSVEGYVKGADHGTQTNDESAYAEMNFIKNNDVFVWKYIANYKNDNPEFFDKRRKDWFMCMTDDSSESYQRADLFPTLCDQYADTMKEWKEKFSDNRRGKYEDYYGK